MYEEHNELVDCPYCGYGANKESNLVLDTSIIKCGWCGNTMIDGIRYKSSIGSIRYIKDNNNLYKPLPLNSCLYKYFMEEQEDKTLPGRIIESLKKMFPEGLRSITILDKQGNLCTLYGNKPITITEYYESIAKEIHNTSSYTPTSTSIDEYEEF